MKIVIIGTGYVGLVTGVCLTSLGHLVTCVDKDIDKIKKLSQGVITIYEPSLEDMLRHSIDNKQISFCEDLQLSLKNVDCVMLAVGTPTDVKTRKTDLTYVFSAAEEVARNLSDDAVIITKSTVPVGTGRRIEDIFKKLRPDLNCQIVSNPEFLREGSAVNDFLNPDRIIVGTNDFCARNIMSGLYRQLIDKDFPILFTNIETAEIIKYASNAYLAMKVAFINEIADICEGTGADVLSVVEAMGMDKRIGSKHMQPGPGFGGSCFPKDTLAIIETAQDVGHPSKIIEAVFLSNQQRKTNMAQRIIKEFKNNISGKVITILGVTFKANTDDIRESPSLDIIHKLITSGAKIKLYDPAGMEEAKKYLSKYSDIVWCGDAYEACEGADAIVIATEWSEFKELDFKKLFNIVNEPVIFDFRNILVQHNLAKIGFKYQAVGIDSKT